jgi:hypothetical protein
VRVQITGMLANPVVRVNAFSALTPGLLRGIFGLGGTSSGTTAGRGRAQPAHRD